MRSEGFPACTGRRFEIKIFWCKLMQGLCYKRLLWLSDFVWKSVENVDCFVVSSWQCPGQCHDVITTTTVILKETAAFLSFWFDVKSLPAKGSGRKKENRDKTLSEIKFSHFSYLPKSIGWRKAVFVKNFAIPYDLCQTWRTFDLDNPAFCQFEIF